MRELEIIVNINAGVINDPKFTNILIHIYLYVVFSLIINCELVCLFFQVLYNISLCLRNCFKFAVFLLFYIAKVIMYFKEVF